MGRGNSHGGGTKGGGGSGGGASGKSKSGAAGKNKSGAAEQGTPENVKQTTTPPDISQWKAVGSKERSYYTLERTENGMEYLRRKGQTLNNPYGMPFSIRRTTDRGGNKEWQITEERTGLLFTSGRTAREAIERAADFMQRVDRKKLQERIDQTVKQYGGSPSYKATYLHESDEPKLPF